MMGWNIGVYRQNDGGVAPAPEKCGNGGRLAIWQAAPEGLRWIEDLVKAGKAILIATNGGYPRVYTARAGDMIPTILGGPPYENKVWLREDDDFVTDAWLGKTTIDQGVIDSCNPDEWLHIEVWDES